MSNPPRSFDAAQKEYESNGCVNKPPTDATCLELNTNRFAARKAHEQAAVRATTDGSSVDSDGSSADLDGGSSADPDDDKGGIGSGSIVAIIFCVVVLPIGLVLGYLVWARRNGADDGGAATFNPTSGPPHATAPSGATARPGNVQHTANALYNGPGAGTKKKKTKINASARKGSPPSRPANSALYSAFEGFQADSGKHVLLLAERV